MGNIHAGCKIISKVIRCKYALNFNHFENFQHIKSQSSIRLYLFENLIETEMPPKRGRPAASKDTNTLKQKATEDENDVPVLEKKPTSKRGREPTSKLLSENEKTKMIVNEVDNDDSDDDDDVDNDDKMDDAELNEQKKITKKPTRGGGKKKEAALVKDDELKEVRKSGRKQRVPTRRQIQHEEDDEEESEVDSEPEPIPVKKSSSRKPKSATKDIVEGSTEMETDDVVESQPKGMKKAVRGAKVVAKPIEKKNKNDSDNVEEPPAKKAKTETKLLNPTDTDLDSIDYDCDKLNSKGEKYNLKICSWNVSGIRALIKKNGMRYFSKENADIIAIQETKCNMTKLPDGTKIPGYKHYYLDSEKPGYCGVALYCKNDHVPIEIKYGVNNSELDKEGRLITAEFDNFYLINVYVPNSGQKLVTMPKRLKWNDIFKAYVKKLDEKKPVIICGDMNVAHQEIDLTNPKTNMKNAGFTKEEREGMTDFLAAGFSDTFRQLYPDKTGAYTFWSYFANSRSKNIGWRLDYFIVSESIKDTVCDNIIRSSVHGSDHCPIVLYAKL